MTRLLYDSTVAANIPADAEMVAGYVDGLYKWTPADWARFPNAVKVRIAINPATNDGHALDIEPGNWDAAASVDWTIMRRASGVVPTIYCGTWAPGYTWQDVIDAHDARGVPRPQIWLAYYDGIQVIPDGCVAKQYANDAMLGFGADASVAADYWPGVDAPPPVPPPPDPDPADPCAQYRQNDANAVTRIQRAQAELVEAIANITYP